MARRNAFIPVDPKLIDGVSVIILRPPLAFYVCFYYNPFFGKKQSNKITLRKIKKELVFTKKNGPVPNVG